jgi:hypothetical protein
MLSSKRVRVPLLERERKLVYVFSAFAPVPYYVIATLRISAKVEQVVRAKSTINHNGTCVAP